MASWINSQSGISEAVGPAFAKMRELLISSGVGGGAPDSISGALLAIADNAAPCDGPKQSSWCSNGGMQLCNGTAAMSKKDKQAILLNLASGLKENQNLILELSGASSRTLPQVIRTVHVLVVGASNSYKLSSALEEMGITTGRVTTANWKPSKDSVDILAAYVKTSVEEEKPAAVVFQMHDNLPYMGRNITVMAARNNSSRTRMDTTTWRETWSWPQRMCSSTFTS